MAAMPAGRFVIPAKAGTQAAPKRAEAAMR